MRVRVITLHLQVHHQLQYVISQIKKKRFIVPPQLRSSNRPLVHVWPRSHQLALSPAELFAGMLTDCKLNVEMAGMD